MTDMEMHSVDDGPFLMIDPTETFKMEYLEGIPLSSEVIPSDKVTVGHNQDECPLFMTVTEEPTIDMHHRSTTIHDSCGSRTNRAKRNN